MKKHLTYLYLLLSGNLKSHILDKKKFMVMALTMFLQNFFFFFLWIIFFEKVSHLKGWELQEFSQMIGIVHIAFGICNTLFTGIRTLPHLVQDGSFEAYLVRPRHPLLPLLCSASSPTAVGDIAFGFFVFPVWGGVSLEMMPMLVLVTIISTVILMASTILVYSMSLWLKGNTRFPDQLYELLLIFSMNVIHGQPLFVKAVAFTIIPAAFINYLPTKMLYDFNWSEMGVLLFATVFYSVAAVWMFNAGVRRYKRMVS